MKRIFTLALLLSLLLALLSFNVASTKAASPHTCGGWSVVSSPNVGNEDYLDQLTQVPGTNDLWAAGISSPRINSRASTLIEFYC